MEVVGQIVRMDTCSWLGRMMVRSQGGKEKSKSNKIMLVFHQSTRFISKPLAVAKILAWMACSHCSQNCLQN